MPTETPIRAKLSQRRSGSRFSFLLSTAASNLKRSDTSGDFLSYVLVARWHRPIRLNAFVADFVPYGDVLSVIPPSPVAEPDANFPLALQSRPPLPSNELP